MADEDLKDDGKEPEVRVVDRRWWARDPADSQDDDRAGRKPTYVEDLERQLSDVRARLQEVTSAHRQSIDEFEQARLRIRREIGKDIERGRRAVLADLLEVLDNLDRAIAASRDADTSGGGAAVDSLARGVELVRGQFLAKLEGYGVTRLAALGEPFDAARHEAISMAPVADEAQDGLVLAVIREGYTIGDDLLRPAAVVVGRHESG